MTKWPNPKPEIKSDRSLQDESVVITLLSGLDGASVLYMHSGGELIASAVMPNAGPSLSKFAFARGAIRVKHDYDLRRDEP